MADAGVWRRCSSCKKPIGFGAQYWVCNVSTCTRPRVGFVFCTVSCWDAHLGVVRHRESWALERRSPSQAEWEREQGASSPVPVASPAADTAASERTPRRVLPAPATRQPDPVEDDVLVVMSKLKGYVRARSGFNTSDRVAQALSEALRTLCDRAIQKARAEGRKTVLDRDFD